MNNPEIEQIVDGAVRLARDSRHEYVMTEHVLLSLVKYDPFRQLLEKFGVEVERLEQELESYLGSLAAIVGAEPVPPKKTNALERVFNRALTQVLFTGRKAVSTLDLYLAIM